jgi:hypothetical protein
MLLSSAKPMQSGAPWLFWKGEDGRVTGIRRQRMATLLANDINLLAYHLPLDAHPELGNNAQLALRLGWLPDGRFGEQDIAWLGTVAEPVDVSTLTAKVSRVLGRPPLMIGDGARPVRRIAWCSGGAQGYFEQAIALGVDAYLSGEISEQTVHLARERRGLSGSWPPCDGTLWCSGARRTSGTAIRHHLRLCGCRESGLGYLLRRWPVSAVCRVWQCAETRRKF